MKTLLWLALILVGFVILGSGLSAFASESEMDGRIEASARQSFVFQKYLKDDDIIIVSEDGVVTLTGTVAEEPHKTLAQETVASLPGVKSVDNRLEIKNIDIADNLDAWLTVKVKAALLFHKNLSVSNTGVQVNNGVVTLSGETFTRAQKDLATEYIKDVEGVKGVKNLMIVSKKTSDLDKKTVGEKMGAVATSIDDASITALVKLTLLYHRSTSGFRTNVTTKNGVVTMEGKAKTDAEKELVTKYVQDVYGVETVVNNIVVKGE